MTGTNVLYPHPPEFERFLYASVGEDRNGHGVTVLSTLARLGLDPWNEAAELVRLGHDAARTRLGGLLARVQDVPTLPGQHGRVARELSLLLPDRPPAQFLKGATSTVAAGPLTAGAVWTILAVLFVMVLVLIGGVPEGGE